jgi:hypothetical protein
MSEDRITGAGAQLQLLQRCRSRAWVRATSAAVLMFATFVAGCSDTTPMGTVTGHMYQVGGPAPGSPVAVRGLISLTNVTNGTKYTATSNGKSGYAAQVPVGTYKVSGLSEQDFSNGHEMRGFPASALIKVRQGKTARDNLYASIS